MLNPTLQYSTANGAPVSDEVLMEAITEARLGGVPLLAVPSGVRDADHGSRFGAPAPAF